MNSDKKWELPSGERLPYENQSIGSLVQVDGKIKITSIPDKIKPFAINPN